MGTFRSSADLQDFPKNFGHDGGQARGDLFFVPQEFLEVLDPFEVGYRDPSRIGEDVGHYEDPPVVQDVVRLRRRRSVRALHDQPASQPGCIHLRYLGFQGARDEYVAVELEKLLVRNILRFPDLLIDKATVAVLTGQGIVHVEAPGVDTSPLSNR